MHTPGPFRSKHEVRRDASAPARCAGCCGNSNEAIFGLDEVVAWVSQGEILRPGWLLGSGTVNRGSTIEHDRKLSPGDNVELEIDGLGILQNTIGPKAEGGWEPKPRRPAGH